MDNKQVYRLQGLSCANCAATFEKNVRAIDTVEEAYVNFGAAKLTVVGKATIDQLEKAGAFDGIHVIPEHEQKEVPPVPFWRKRANVLATISAIFLMIGSLLSFMKGEQHGLVIGMFAVAIVIGGYDLFRSGLANLGRLQFDMKTLMTIAIIGAALIGEWKEGAVVVFLFAVSEALERYSMERARRSIQQVMDLAPKTALVKRGTRIEEVGVEELQIDDVIVVKPGQKIAADGIVVSGASSVNEAAITGESMPVHKATGDEVYAGTLNEEGALEVRVTKQVADSTIAKIIHLVEEAQAEKAPAQQFVDRFARYYTPAIMAIAMFVAIVPPILFSEDWKLWIYRGLAVLVVGCPCALVISTPVAIVTAIGRAARQGVLIKGGVYLETLGRLRAIAFDKTGTLTKGTPAVTDIHAFSGWSEKEVLHLLASIEQYSQHPLAKAIVHKATEHCLPLADFHVSDFRSLTGKGVTAVVNGTTYYAGSPLLFASKEMPEEITDVIHTLQQAGKTVVVVGDDKQIFGVIAISDEMRSEAATVVNKLHMVGIRTMMVTGDNEATANAIGKKAGMTDVLAQLLPEEKLRIIKERKQQYGHIAMVGDGVNDAPALAAADVGIAMGKNGTDAALETADVVLMADDLEQLPFVIRLSRQTVRIIQQNITFAFLLKLLALILIVPGWLTLWMAIFADMGATLIVLFNSLRLLRVSSLR
ncbi:Cd2+/Zn2+-exporting ATPase [Anoxybacillus voinovskiensis]|uniref:Cd(2+)-exporting ATPase n=1 Tax=Anoxybacteroides voinovskiense TaxID=230470 RepID=A0A840DV45_9BACL|nr:heavy metal translocating P-type ATPase [Anoxybacillus voinovskiensis]MBB4073888.1 Cd2+/Zn2+-exporting ATPase [Anoxybacillus voinovskiensis]GGJ66376.1 copper-translocating P-type ATPase [Anoxybacillus voinovskiensis]